MKGNILGFTAEDAVPAFRFAKAGTADGKVKLAGAGDACLGVTTDVDSADGRPCDVQLDGIALVECGGSVSFGAAVESDANGKAVTASATPGFATALESGASGDIIGVKVESDKGVKFGFRVKLDGVGVPTTPVNAMKYKAATGGVSKNTFVKLGSTAGEVTTAGAGDAVLGVALNDAAAGADVEVQPYGIASVVASAAIDAGAKIKSAASGKAVTASTANDVVYAIALEAAAAASDVIKVQVGYAGVISE